MRAELNHTIVWCRDKVRSSRFLVELLALGDRDRELLTRGGPEGAPRAASTTMSIAGAR